MGATAIYKDKRTGSQAGRIGIEQSIKMDNDFSKVYNEALNYHSYVVAWQLNNEEISQPKKVDNETHFRKR
ncbi:MAG: hypothetical protein ACM3ME_07920 [Chloroflexota bacterium]|nr:hypothetical protein [Lentimicrobium sp.]